ncbi:MAG: type II secretion system protein [Planctomycetota bacterium]|nr:type II secretion system protein [Planctomycetota bacterium]
MTWEVGPTSIRDRPRRAFTLVELLVCLSVISILIGLLLPALAGARSSARALACAAMQKHLAVALTQYTADNDGWIPGFNTSGFELWRTPAQRTVARLSHSEHRPVQNNDWISPSLGAASGLPRKREARFYAIFERFACAEQALRVPVWVHGGRGNPEMADWIDEHAPRPALGISYLMPANFQLFGGPRREPLLTQWSSAKLQELMKTHTLPTDYTPRIDRVGSFARKIMLADGFRYLDRERTDFDAAYSHQNWGSFTERSACDPLSRSWGRKGGGGTGWNIPVVYRHAGQISAAFWDGHAEPLSVLQSRNPVLWAPTGSRVARTLKDEPDAMQFGYDPNDSARRTIE